MLIAESGARGRGGAGGRGSSPIDSPPAARATPRHRLRLTLIGGPDVHHRIPLLRALGDEFQATVCGSAAELEERFRREGIPYDCYPLRRRAGPWRDLLAAAALVPLLRRRRPHIVHCFDTRPAVAGRLAAAVAGIPVRLATLPGLGALFTYDGLRVRARRSVQCALHALAHLLSDLTIVQQEADRSELVQCGVLSRCTAVVVPGSGVPNELVVPRASRQRRLECRARLGLPGDAVVVATVGRLVRSKGLVDLARACAALRARALRKPLVLAIAGSRDGGALDPLSAVEIEALARSAHLLDSIPDVTVLLDAADLFVFPSWYREGVPRALLEAAARAVPCIACDGAGARQVVIDGSSGRLVPPHTPAALAVAIRDAIEQPERSRRWGERAQRLVRERFTLDLVVARHRALYRELWERCGAPRG